MTHEELEAKLELLTRECDDRRRRCAMLARAHGALADAGCVVPTEMDETIEHAIKALAKERDEARAALAECPDCAMWAERSARWHDDMVQAREERDEARAEVDTLRSQIERLRGVLHIVSLDEYESTTSASEKVHAHARQARIVLNETLADATPSDAAHIASLENLFIKACRRAENLTVALTDMKAQRDEARAGVERLQAEAAPMNEYFTAGYRDGSRDAYRRGAEAMREACQQWCRAWENDGEAIADALADLRVEDKS